MRVDDPRAHCTIGEGSADTDVESPHNSYGQALLKRTQVQKLVHVIHLYLYKSC